MKVDYRYLLREPKAQTAENLTTYLVLSFSFFCIYGFFALLRCCSYPVRGPNSMRFWNQPTTLPSVSLAATPGTSF